MALAASLQLACGAGAPPRFRAEPPLWRDPDRRPFAAELEPYFSPKLWDRWDKSFFRPVSQFFKVDPGGEATNVNALDEVPDSSWFENRISRYPVTPEAVARGACRERELEDQGPWTIVSAKPDGAHPGFFVETPNKQRYLLKFAKAVRTVVGDIVGSLIYHTAGFDVPCNQIVHFDRSVLRVDPEATVERANGKEERMTWADVDAVLAGGTKGADGRFRAVASRYLEGRPLGPWRYHGTRDGDRNDIVPHEDRRELRGARVLAAWTSHWDHREQNTLAMWVETEKGRGYVRHHLLDFGDCFGAMGTQSPQGIWRRAHAHWFDVDQVLLDFVTFGIPERPWDRAKLGPSGMLFGYYDVEQFDPEAWSPSYPNPAFERMTERDAAWMARILARIDPARVEAMVSRAEIDPPSHRELVRILLGRREKLLRRYLTRVSALADAEVVRESGSSWLCAADLAVQAGVARQSRTYAARAWLYEGERATPSRSVVTPREGRVCASLPSQARATPSKPGYVMLEIGTPGSAQYPARFHLYQRGGDQYLLAGLERPATSDDPE